MNRFAVATVIMICGAVLGSANSPAHAWIEDPQVARLIRVQEDAVKAQREIVVELRKIRERMPR